MTEGHSAPPLTGPSTDVPMRLVGVLAFCAALYSLAFAGFAAWDQDWTTDEHIHLDWSERFWNSGEQDRDSVARFASTTPIHVPNVALRQFAERLGVEEDQPRRFAARIPQVFWLATLLLGAGGLGRRLGGAVAGRMAALFAALDPNLTAHASVATTDIALAAATTFALWAAVAQRQEPRPRHAAALGASLGLALTAKFSAVLLVPIALGAAFVKGHPRTWAGRQFVLSLCLAWFVLSGAYGFKGLFAPLDSSGWQSPAFQAAAAAAPKVPMPIPASFLEGVDRSRARDAAARPIVAILGHVGPEPVWYYFLAAWSLKTPIVLIVFVFASLPWLLLDLRRRGDVAWLVAHQAITLLFFSLAFRTQLGYRYALMLVPITYALAAATASGRVGRRTLAALTLAATLISMSETARFWGDPLAFSNALVQPKSKAYLFLANADIDWNQNRDRWSRWQRATGLPDNGSLNPVDPVQGVNVVSTSHMAGVFPGDRFKWVRENLEPRAMAGWTHHYFDLTTEQYDRFLRETRRLAASREAEALCGLSAAGAMDPPGRAIRFEASEAPSGRRVSALCVATRKGTDLAAGVIGGGRFDLIPFARTDLATRLTADDVVQFRLDPGVHMLAIVETPYRRVSLPYELTATFISIQYGALLKLVRLEPGQVPAGIAGSQGALALGASSDDREPEQ